MNCRKCRRLSSDYINGALNEGYKSGITEHINDCTDCRIYMERLRSDRASLEEYYNQRTTGVKAEADFAEETYRRLSASERGKGVGAGQAVWSYYFSFFRMLRPILVGAAGLVMGIFVTFGLFRAPGPATKIVKTPEVKQIEHAPFEFDLIKVEAALSNLVSQDSYLIHSEGCDVGFRQVFEKDGQICIFDQCFSGAGEGLTCPCVKSALPVLDGCFIAEGRQSLKVFVWCCGDRHFRIHSDLQEDEILSMAQTINKTLQPCI